MSDSLGPHGLLPTRLLCPWNSPDKNIGVGCHFLLQLVAFRTIRNTEWYSENPSENTVFSPVCRAIEPRWPCNTCCRKLEKDPSSATAPAPRLLVSLHMWSHQSSHYPSSCHLHTQSSLGQRCQRLEKILRGPNLLCPWLPGPLCTSQCQGPYDPRSCTMPTPGPHQGRPKSSRAASGANSCG